MENFLKMYRKIYSVRVEQVTQNSGNQSEFASPLFLMVALWSLGLLEIILSTFQLLELAKRSDHVENLVWRSSRLQRSQFYRLWWTYSTSDSAMWIILSSFSRSDCRSQFSVIVVIVTIEFKPQSFLWVLSSIVQQVVAVLDDGILIPCGPGDSFENDVLTHQMTTKINLSNKSWFKITKTRFTTNNKTQFTPK